MTSLVACLSSGKGTWAHVSRLIGSEPWEKGFLITNDFGLKTFRPDAKTRMVQVDESKGIEALIQDIKGSLENEIIDTEVAVNLVSGTGKEHMAVISALLKMGLGLRLVYSEEDKCLQI